MTPLQTPEFSIRTMAANDIEGVVEVHIKSFPNFFLTCLGETFLKIMYREILNDPTGVALCAVSPENTVFGFVVGVQEQTRFYKRLAMKKCLSFALASSMSALKNPRIIPRLFRALTYSSKSQSAACPALLLSIAVRNGMQGNGIGKLLLVKINERMAQNGIDRVSLTTDRDNNSGANSFYVRAGFSVTSQYKTPEGRWMNEYIKKIN